MCSATLLPDPERPLTMMSRIALGAVRPPVRSFGRVMVRELFLALLHPPVELVDERVDRGVHVAVDGVGMDAPARERQRRFGLVSQFLDGEHAVYVDDVIEMPRDALELLLDVALERRRDFHVMTAEIELHRLLLFWAGLRG